MPFYEYTCKNGHTVERMRPVDERHDEVVCDHCGKMAKFEISAPHFGVLKMGVDSGFPTFYEKWGKMQTKKNIGKMKDSSNHRASDKTLNEAGLL